MKKRLESTARRFGFVPAKELYDVVWRLNATEKQLVDLQKRQAELVELLQAPPPKKRRLWFTQGLLLLWVAIIGVVIGGTAIPRANDTPQLVPEIGINVPPADPTTTETRIQTLAWLASPRATEYEVQVWDASNLVVEHRVPQTTIDVVLRPGEYRWIVYPVVDGLRQPATVSSSLTVQ